MAEEILINVTRQETRVAVLDHGVIEELHIERASHRGIVGNIYLGRVARVLPGMQSAFVEIGLERAAFLHVADIWEFRQGQHTPEITPKPIEKLLHEGQPIIVQVIKDPIGTKCTSKRPAKEICVDSRAPLVPIGSLMTCTMSGCPSCSNFSIGFGVISGVC